MNNPDQDLKEIKSIMERSTRFLSLSGTSGILIGIYATIAAGIAHKWLYSTSAFFEEVSPAMDSEILIPKFIMLAGALIVLTLITSYFLSQKRGKQKSESIWSAAGMRFISGLFIPLIAGGLICLSQVLAGKFDLIAGITLSFYGLALINASNFSVSAIKKLGYLELSLGVIAFFFPSLGLLFWWLGFGLVHVIYGILMYFKFEK